MNSKLKSASVAGLLLAGCTTFSGSALAAACPNTQTLTAFITAGSCSDADKLYTYVATTLPSQGTNTLEVSNFTIGGETTHNFSVNLVDVLTTTGIYTWNYTIQITDPLKFFGNISLDSDVPQQNPDVKILKVIDLDNDTSNGSFSTLTSLSGSPSALLSLPGGIQKLWIYETIRIDQGDVDGTGALNSFTNTFTQNTTNIPEPGTVALLGLGLAGLAAARRRMK